MEKVNKLNTAGLNERVLILLGEKIFNFIGGLSVVDCEEVGKITKSIIGNAMNIGCTHSKDGESYNILSKTDIKEDTAININIELFDFITMGQAREFMTLYYNNTTDIAEEFFNTVIGKLDRINVAKSFNMLFNAGDKVKYPDVRKVESIRTVIKLGDNNEYEVAHTIMVDNRAALDDNHLVIQVDIKDTGTCLHKVDAIGSNQLSGIRKFIRVSNSGILSPVKINLGSLIVKVDHSGIYAITPESTIGIGAFYGKANIQETPVLKQLRQQYGKFSSILAELSLYYKNIGPIGLCSEVEITV